MPPGSSVNWLRPFADNEQSMPDASFGVDNCERQEFCRGDAESPFRAASQPRWLTTQTRSFTIVLLNIDRYPGRDVIFGMRPKVC